MCVRERERDRERGGERDQEREKEREKEREHTFSFSRYVFPGAPSVS